MTEKNRVIDVLTKYYSRSDTLRSFLISENKVFDNLLVKEDDSRDYIDFLDLTLVAVLPEARTFPKSTEFAHFYSVDEILVRTFIKLKKRRDIHNIISSRLNSITDAYLTLTSVKTFCEKNDYNYFFEKHWSLLLERVGDVILSYLIENCTIFVFVSNSCYLQISGVPLQDVVTKNRHAINSRSNYNLKSKQSRSKFTSIKNRKSLERIDTMECRGDISALKSMDYQNVFKKCGSSNVTGEQDKPNNVAICGPEFPKGAKRRRRKKANSEELKDYKVFDENITVDKNKFLYCREQPNWSVSRCVLNNLVLRDDLIPSNIKHVLMKIQLFQSSPSNHKHNFDLSDSNFAKLHVLFSTLLRRHGRGKYKHYFNHSVRHKEMHLAISDLRQQDASVTLNSLLLHHVPQWRVYLFVKLCITNVVPYELFGNQSNRITFQKNVKQIIFSGRFETISLGQLMQGIKSKCEWLKHISSNSDRLQILARIHIFLMENYVIALIKSYFYVTDSTVYKNRLFYFPKMVWRLICQKAFEKLNDQGMLEPITEQKANALVSEGKSLGFAYLRFMPKANSVRLIVNMKKKQRIVRFRGTTINWQLQDLHRVFVLKKSEKPELLGSSLFSISDIYNRWKNYCASNHGYKGPYYFVKVDIKGCYDSISQKKIYHIVKDYLKPYTTYAILRYSSVILGAHKPIVNRVREATEFAAYPGNFFKYIQKVIQTSGLENVIFTCNENPWLVDTSRLLARLKSHLLGNILKYGKNYYLQTKGISQGSVISTMLCNLYYADMESRCLSLAKDELLMRQVDDFLFVSKSLVRAKSFLRLMLDGIPEYCFIANVEKTLVNFDYILNPGNACPKSGQFFPFCGLLFDTILLEVSPNFSKYSGLSVKDSISTGYTSHPGLAVESKLLFSMKFQCHAIFFDISLNSLETIANNIYKIFLLTAFKFAHCIKYLPMPDSINVNPEYFLRVLNNLSVFLYMKCLRKLNHERDLKLLSKWLCYKAFETRLSQHRAQFHPLLKMIYTWLSNSLQIDEGIRLNLYPQEFQLMFF